MYRIRARLIQFSGEVFGLCLFQFSNASYRFWNQDISSPVAGDLFTSVPVISPDSFHQLKPLSSS